MLGGGDTGSIIIAFLSDGCVGTEASGRESFGQARTCQIRSFGKWVGLGASGAPQGLFESWLYRSMAV